MRSIRTLVFAAVVALASTSVASAQYYYPAPPVVSYSYYPPTYVTPTYVTPAYYQPSYYQPTYVPPTYVQPVTSYYAPAPVVSYYPQAYGAYAQTTTYGGLGIFRPRQQTTYYYYPR